MRDRLLTWFFLGALGGIVPLIAEVVVRLATNKDKSPPAIVGRGELLLISVVIGSSAVGALVSSTAGRRTRMIAWGIGFPSLMAIGVYYGGISASPVTINEHFVATWSSVVFGVTILLGALCVGLAREAQ